MDLHVYTVRVALLRNQFNLIEDAEMQAIN